LTRAAVTASVFVPSWRVRLSEAGRGCLRCRSGLRFRSNRTRIHSNIENRARANRCNHLRKKQFHIRYGVAVVGADFLAECDDAVEFDDEERVVDMVGFSFRSDDQPVGFLGHDAVELVPSRAVEEQHASAGEQQHGRTTEAHMAASLFTVESGIVRRARHVTRRTAQQPVIMMAAAAARETTFTSLEAKMSIDDLQLR